MCWTSWRNSKWRSTLILYEYIIIFVCHTLVVRWLLNIIIVRLFVCSEYEQLIYILVYFKATTLSCSAFLWIQFSLLIIIPEFVLETICGCAKLQKSKQETRSYSLFGLPSLNTCSTHLVHATTMKATITVIIIIIIIITSENMMVCLNFCFLSSVSSLSFKQLKAHLSLRTERKYLISW